jgi:uncharacterized protein YbbK (DUF523 family)
LTASIREKVLVSACLAGIPCRYDGESKPAATLDRLLAGREAVLVCPEELGGLGTPRPPAELRGGDGAAVLRGEARVATTEHGRDVAAAFVEGARRARAAAPGASVAVLKARSPSCGCGRTWIDGAVRDGDGVFAALLRAEGVELLTDED